MGRGSQMATTSPPSPTRAHSAGKPELETAGWVGGGGQSTQGRGLGSKGATTASPPRGLSCLAWKFSQRTAWKLSVQAASREMHMLFGCSVLVLLFMCVPRVRGGRRAS